MKACDQQILCDASLKRHRALDPIQINFEIDKQTDQDCEEDFAFNLKSEIKTNLIQKDKQTEDLYEINGLESDNVEGEDTKCRYRLSQSD